jgi:hypothetical protein
MKAKKWTVVISFSGKSAGKSAIYPETDDGRIYVMKEERSCCAIARRLQRAIKEKTKVYGKYRSDMDIQAVEYNGDKKHKWTEAMRDIRHALSKQTLQVSGVKRVKSGREVQEEAGQEKGNEQEGE